MQTTHFRTVIDGIGFAQLGQDYYEQKQFVEHAFILEKILELGSIPKYVEIGRCQNTQADRRFQNYYFIDCTLSD